MRTSPTHHRARRGFALMDVIVGGIVLAIGMTVVLALTSRSIAWQADGERRLVASWLADEMLNMVIVEGPVEYGRIYDTSGTFDPPFQQYSFNLEITEISVTEPYLVTATISWEHGNTSREIQVQTFIAQRTGDEGARIPVEPLDRMERYYGGDSSNDSTSSK